MSTDVTQDPGQPAAPAAPAVSFPADYEDLKAQAQQLRELQESLQPYVDDIRPIIEDEDTRNFLRSARETYQERREKQKPQLSPELQMLRESLVGEVGPVIEYVQGERQAREAAAKEAAESAQRANVEYAKRLAAERPDLAEDNFAGIGMLAAYAANRGLSLEDAYKTAGSRFAAPVKEVKEPPRSLRGDSAAPGVPGESTALPIKSTGDLRKRLAANLRSAGMKG